MQRVRTDPHSPNRLRVEGTLRNVREFAEAWGCPVGSKVHISLIYLAKDEADWRTDEPAGRGEMSPVELNAYLDWMSTRSFLGVDYSSKYE